MSVYHLIDSLMVDLSLWNGVPSSEFWIPCYILELKDKS